MSDLAVFAALLAIVSLFRNRLRTLPITTPMLFVGLGLLLGPKLLGVIELDVEDEMVVLIAELTLASVLFADATRIDTRRDALSFGLPARLLAIGLPLAIAMGTVVTKLLLTDLSWAEAALVATILAPTDAALGEAVVSNSAVPVRIRQALNVESGLNDGLVVPVFSLLLAFVAGSELDGAGSLVGEALGEIAIGLAIGVAIAGLVAVVLPVVTARAWIDSEGFRLVALGCGLGAYAGAETLGGNGFLAAFACGLAIRYRLGSDAAEHAELAEDIGQVGASATFVLFGALLVVPALEVLSPAVVLCALGTLSLGRMIPVAVAMLGAGLKAPTVAFMGWFGPRGLASMLFGLLVAAERGVESAEDLFAVVVLVVLGSVVLHGVSAAPGARRYGAWFTEHGRHHDMPEAEMVTETPMRWDRSD